MNSYRIEGGTASIGLGEVIGLTAAQLAPRRHLVDVMDSTPGNPLTIVRAKASLQFKVGEVVVLAAAPPKGQAERFVPADAPPPDEPLKTKKKATA